MNSTKLFNFFADGGHGWLAVKRSLLRDLKISHLITRFSHQNGSTVYLEEDQDVATFVKAYRKKFPTVDIIRSREKHSKRPSSHIRGYAQYVPTEYEMLLSAVTIVKVNPALPKQLELFEQGEK